MMRSLSAVVCALLLMMFVQESNCCCNVDTGTGYLSSPNSSLEIDTQQIKCTSLGSDLPNVKYELQCNGTTLSIRDSMSHSVTKCNDPVCTTLHNPDMDCPSNTSYECQISNVQEHMTVLYISCSNSISSSHIPSNTTTKPTIDATSSVNKTDLPTKQPRGSSTSPSTGTSGNMFTSTRLAGTITSPSSSGDIIPVLLAIIIGLMALFICIMVATMIIRKLRKRKHRYTINDGRDLIHQENIYQMGPDGNRRPSRIIPIVTHGGECLEITEFPRYNDIGNHHKLSNTSLSMSYEKGGFPADQVVPMATASNPNGRYPQEHFYSVIPPNKVGHSEHHSEAHFLTQRDHHHPRVHTPQINITHSSQSSLNGDIDPYSTLDEARNEAQVEMRSTHTIDEQSDDILILNMFGSDKPKWTHDMRPLHLNIPTSRKMSGRVSVGSEDEYITMTGGDLEGGWGEVRTRAHMSGFDTTSGLQQGYEHKSGFDLSEKVQYNRPMHEVNHPSQELRENEVETDGAPPTPDKSIEDLYAKVRKKSKKSQECSESSDDEVTFIVDDDGSPSQRDYLIPPSPEFSEATKKDQALHKGQKHREVTTVQPSSSGENGSTNQGERNTQIEVQAGKTAKQASGNTHTL